MHERLPLSLLCGLCALILSAMGCSDGSATIGLGPQLTFEPPMLAFGNVQIGTEASQVVLLRNATDEPLVLEVALRDKSPDKSFRVESDRATISPQGIVELTIYFAPTGIEPVSGELVVRPDKPPVASSILAISGSGVSTTIVVDPDSLSFENVVLNSLKTLPVTVSNVSDADASIEFTDGRNVQRCATGAGQSTPFCVHLPPDSVQSDGRFSLRTGESRSLDVEFRPTNAGLRQRGTFTLRACDNPACETEILLDGLGIEQGLRCNPPVLDFAQVNPGACLAETMSCENIASDPMTIVGWGPSSDPSQTTSPDFTFEPSRPVVLNGGESFDVDVTYCPSGLGHDAGYLQIETDRPAPYRFVRVGLNGTGGGPDIEVLPGRLDFGLVSVIAPTRRNVLVTNVGLDDLEISSINADTAGTGAFSAPDAGATVIPPGGSHVITVEFQPVVEGSIESSLLISSNDRDEAELQVRLLGEGLILPTCDFEVSPLPLNFGVVQVQRFQGRAVQIRNVGSNDCLVTSARLEPGTDPEFSLPEGEVRTQIIAPGNAFTVGVDYAPLAAGTHTGALEFSISSATSPFNRVPLVGTAAQATLLIAPNEIDFGTVDLSCATGARTVRVYNPSSTPALITDIRLTGTSSAAFILTAQPAPLPAAPVSILPGQFIEFMVSFEGGAASRYVAAVEISAVFEGSPTTSLVSLHGETSIAGIQEDGFEQLSTAKVDLLFVIDFTGSMGQEQAALADNFSAFLHFAQAQTLDYQIGVTSTGIDEEAGRLMHADAVRGDAFAGPAAHRFVSSTTSPDPQTVFTKNVQGRPLTGGSARDEAGLYASYLALSPPVITGHNAGFLRADAALSVVYVSDEAEQSHTSFGAPASDVDFYVDFLRSVKGFRDESLFSASAIVGDAPGGCDGAGGAAAPGPRYIELANRTGGTFQSICTSDWLRSLEDLATTAFGMRSSFSLTSRPIISTIEVRVDGAIVPGALTSGTINWRYDLASNTVRFSPFATPQPGAQIVVRYTTDCL